MSNTSKIIKTQKEAFFSKFFIFPSYIALFLGLITLPNGGIIMLIALFIITSRSGLQINIAEKKHRDYVRILGFYTGKWKDVSGFQYITIITQDTLQTIYPGPIPLGFNVKNKQCEIYLLDTTHKRKILLERLKNIELAKPKLDFYAQAFNVEIVRYSPKGGIRIKNGDISALINR